MFNPNIGLSVNNSSSYPHFDYTAVLERLEQFDATFGVDYHNLFDILADLSQDIHAALVHNEVSAAQTALSQLITLMYVIKDKLPADFFEMLENFVFASSHKPAC